MRKSSVIGWSLVAALLVFAAWAFTPSYAAFTYSHVITLEPGWSAVSPTRVVDTHVFSTTENSTNFDIYLLDPSQPSGWATMAQMGQSEFVPLYGYFINNKTGVRQTLTLNYTDGLSPAQRLFSRSLGSTEGWYSVGVANPTYAWKQCEGADTGSYDYRSLTIGWHGFTQLIDFAAGDYADSPSSVYAGNDWEIRSSNDLWGVKPPRETKAYAVYMTEQRALLGFQNTGELNDCPPPPPPPTDVCSNLDGIQETIPDGYEDPEVDGICTTIVTPPPPFDGTLWIWDSNANPGSQIVQVDDVVATDNVLLLVGDIHPTGGDVSITSVTVEIEGIGAATDVIAGSFTLEINGDVVGVVDSDSCYDGNCSGFERYTFSGLSAHIPAYNSVAIKVYASVNGLEAAVEGASLVADIDNDDVTAVDANEDPISPADITGYVGGNEQIFFSSGIIPEFLYSSEYKSGDSPEVGTFSIRFKVTAFGDDMYVPNTCGVAGIRYDDDWTSHTPDDDCAVSSTAELTPNNNFVISEDTTETITLTVSVIGDDEYHRIVLTGVDWSNTDTTTSENTYDYFLDDYRTDELFLAGEGIDVSLDSITETKTGDDDEIAQIEFRFLVTAYGSDATIDSDDLCSGFSRSVNGIEVACSVSSTATYGAPGYTVYEDTTKLFTVAFAIDGTSEFVSVDMIGIDYTTDNTSGTMTVTPATDWESGSIFVL